MVFAALAAGWLYLATKVAVVIGRAIRLADDLSRTPENAAAG